jgi:DNA-binding CsgD family transcriptional regulator
MTTSAISVRILAVVADVVGLVEAAYQPDGGDTEWLGRVLEIARPWLDEGIGVCGFLYDNSKGGPPRLWAPVAVGSPWNDAYPQVLQVAFAAAPREVTRRFFGQPAPISTTSVELNLGARIAEFPMYRDVLAQFGIGDSVTICASDPSGIGCFLCGPRAKPTRATRQQRSLWNRLAAHVAAGARLRRNTPTVDAVLRPDGHVEHAEGEVAASKELRNELHDAARRVDRARGRLRRDDPDEALDVWRGLVVGRWSLVDQFDHDGRRFVVARRNEPSVQEEAALSERERQVLAYAARGWSNKVIAYHLGLSISTVSSHLTGAARKLGATTRIGAIQSFRERHDE